MFIVRSGCQLSDFSLRSQSSCYTADISTTFLNILKTKTFLHIPSQNHQQFWLYFAKRFCDFRQRREKHPTQLVCGNAYVKHFAKFPDCFDGNTALSHKYEIKNNVLPKTEPCDTPQTISNGFDSASQIFDIIMRLVQLTSRPW